MSIVHNDYRIFEFETFDNFPLQSIQFRIVYKTEDDLKNILLSCKNYFRSVFFQFQISEDSGYPLYNFMLEYKSSPYWKSIEELELVNCELKTILNIISEISLPNLKSLCLDKFRSEDVLNEFDWSDVKNYTLQKLSLRFYTKKIYDESLLILFKCFPNMTEFKMTLAGSLSNNFPFVALPKGLRSLDISTYENFETLSFLNYLSTFSLLTKLKIVSNRERYSNLDLNMTIYLPNLTELTTHQWLFNSATFVLPKLRVLILDLIHNSSLDNLKEFENLKKIELRIIDEGITQKVLNSGFLFSLSNLNEFYSGEARYCKKLNYDFVSDEISKSLIYLHVNDIWSTSNNNINDNGKRLQGKKIPYLSKYDYGIMEYRCFYE